MTDPVQRAKSVKSINKAKAKMIVKQFRLKIVKRRYNESEIVCGNLLQLM